MYAYTYLSCLRKTPAILSQDYEQSQSFPVFPPTMKIPWFIMVLISRMKAKQRGW